METREEWLMAAVDMIRPMFDDTELTVPEKVRVSTGYSKRPPKNSIGWCWTREASTDGVNQIFISPELGDTFQVLGVLVHELIHAADNGESGHKGTFARVARQIGLQGHMTASVVHPGTELGDALEEISRELGDYPHGALTPSQHARIGTQTTRMLKVTCAYNPDYKLRMTRKMLDTYGAPRCPCHDEEMEMDIPPS